MSEPATPPDEPRFAWTWVSIACEEGDRAVRALSIGPLAVHRSLIEAGEFSISHVASGLGIQESIAPIEAALDLAVRLAAVEGWDLCTRENRVGGTKLPDEFLRRVKETRDGFVAELSHAPGRA